MIIEKVVFRTIEEQQRWMTSSYRNDIIDLTINNRWEKENILRMYEFRNGQISIERGKDAQTLKEIPVGSLINNGYVDGNRHYWDNPYWSELFGKTCIFNEDAPAFSLFLKSKKSIIHPLNTQLRPITQIAMRDVLKTMGIEIELYSDADVYLLPSRDKFACGYSRKFYAESRELKDPLILRYEGGWITFYMNHTLFQDILPEEEYTRENSKDPDHGGLDGIENKYPDFDRNVFLTSWYDEIARIIQEEITETRELEI